jgi:DNA-binding beta-propeller fold protein YncE
LANLAGLSGLAVLAILFFSLGLLPPVAAAFEKIPAEYLFEITEAGGLPLKQPTDVAVAGNRLYVLDGLNHRVAVFDLGGGYLQQFGGGAVQGRAIGLCAGPGGRIYVADADTAKVTVYSGEGKVQSSFTVTPVKKGGKPEITDCAVSEKGEIFLVDNDNHHIHVYGRNGSRLRGWGSFGEEDNQFRYPATVALDGHGTVYVVDVINNKVKGFRPSGELSLWFGGWGITPGKLYRPKGVMISGTRVFVSDSYTGAIQVFDTSGAFTGLLALGDGPNLRLKTPTNMAFSGNRLFVVEQLKNRISVWKVGK